MVDDRVMSPRFGGAPGGGIPGEGMPFGKYPGSRPRKMLGFPRLPTSRTETSEQSKPQVQEAADNQTGRGAGDHPDPGRGPLNRLRSERRQRQVSELNQRLLQLNEHQDSLCIEEICASKQKSEQYQRAALRSARNSLDAARSALVMERLGRRNLDPEQIRATVAALQDKAWWDELLRSYGLDENETAKAAARDLAERVAGLQANRISVNSLSLLIADIDFLRKEIDLASHQAGLLSPGLVREYITAASSVASQVMVGLAAASASAEASGANVTPDVIYSAIGLAVASSLTEIYRRASRNLKARTIHAQLQRYHYEVVDAIRDLASFMPWLTGPPLPSEEAVHAVRSACLAAGFLVSHVEQLALSFTWPERGNYRDALHALRTILQKIHNITVEQRYQEIQEMQTELENANGRLREFNPWIDGLAVLIG